MIAKVTTTLAVTENDEPRNLVDVYKTKDPEGWIKASKTELETLRKFGTFITIRRKSLKGHELIIPSRFVYKQKRSGKKKARLVAGGHKQFETWFGKHNGSPTADPLALRIFLVKTVGEEYFMFSIDFKGAYLNSNLEHDVYVEFPKGIQTIDTAITQDMIMLLKRGLYGLKESGRLWYETLRNFLENNGFVASSWNPCIFQDKEEEILILVYVDDCLVSSKTEEAIKRLKKKILKKFEVTESDLDDFLGLQISYDRSKGVASLSAEKYIEKCLKELGLQECNSVKTPIPLNTRIEEGDVPYELDDYREYLGKLLWIAKARPDIAFAAHLLSTVANKPTKKAFGILKRTFRYLKGTISKKLSFTKPEVRGLVVFTDASLGDLNKGRSTGSCFIFYGQNLLYYHSRRQTVVSTSTFESEMLEVVRGIKNYIYVEGFLHDLDFNSEQKPILMTDAQIVMDNLSAQVVNRKTRHYVMKLHFVKQVLKNERIVLAKVDGKDNVADFGTKALCFKDYQK